MDLLGGTGLLQPLPLGTPAGSQTEDLKIKEILCVREGQGESNRIYPVASVSVTTLSPRETVLSDPYSDLQPSCLTEVKKD